MSEIQEVSKAITLECSECSGREWFAQEVYEQSNVTGLEYFKIVLHCVSCQKVTKEFDLDLGNF